MSEWAVAGIIVSVGSLVVSIAVFTAKCVVPLNTAITELNSTLKNIQRELGDLTATNNNSHKRIHERIDANENRLDKHDVILERLKTIHEIGGGVIE